AAMLGHVFTLWGRVFFGSWKGGKGVATGAGLIAGLIPVATLVAVAVFALTMAATRWVSLGSILGALSLPVTLGVQTALGVHVAPPVWGFALLVPLFILWTHRANVRRLLDGTEPRLSDKASRVEA
ncbi:MAG TPA: glycerol-3-phosphate acyltransferase, partial [Rubricoccaceae bacterium]